MNCTFYNNSSAAAFAGAIHNRGLAADDVLVSNCIFWNNGNYQLYSEYPQANATISTSCVQGGLSNSNFANLGGIITTDPLFADNMCRLQKLSPCVNTGHNDSYPSPDKDLDGRMRIRSLIIDMGCFEYDNPPTGIKLSADTVDEGVESATNILFTVVDPDPEDTLWYNFELVEGNGTNDADNALFFISYSQLYSIFALDYEAKSSFNIYVKAKHLTEDPELMQAVVIHVKDLNDPVRYNSEIIMDHQRVVAGNPFSFTFPENLFYDPDVNDTLIYTASKADGTALPAWLSFNGATRTFSGTPLNKDEGFLTVKIKAEDSGGTSDATTLTLIVEFNTGIDEKGNRIFTVYPNPANDYLIIRIPNQALEDHTLSLYDLQGKLIRQYEKVNTESFTLSLKGVEAGVYVVKVEGGEVVGVRRVVVGIRQ